MPQIKGKLTGRWYHKPDVIGDLVLYVEVLPEGEEACWRKATMEDLINLNIR